MTPGDMPCNVLCYNRWCPYCSCNRCTDNAVCERQMDEDGSLTHDKQS